MGNQKRALKLIINELQDVDKVSTFIGVTIVSRVNRPWALYQLNFHYPGCLSYAKLCIKLVGGVNVHVQT
jgi:hypothetical protein